MAARLDVEYIELKNFLSYGNYVTRLYVKDAKGGLGPVLVLGENSEDESDSSNGAGKSSLLTAFIWCLFGRTITNPNPGDKVVNWYVDSDCYVKIKTTDGWEIIRTRKIDGHAELILKKDGRVDDTHSTSTNTQKELNRIFGLDYEIFVSSVFCGQFSKSFLEMPSVKRKEALERILGLHKLNEYADSAKKEFKRVEEEQNAIRTRIEFLKTDVGRQKDRLQEHEGKEHGFELEKELKIEAMEIKIEDLSNEMDKIDLPNLEMLVHKWETVKAINAKLEEYNGTVRANKSEIIGLEKSLERYETELAHAESGNLPDIEKLREEWQICYEACNKQIIISGKARDQEYAVDRHRREIKILENKISKWRKKALTTCVTCDQVIDAQHALKHIEIINSQMVDIIEQEKTAKGMLEGYLGQLEELGSVGPHELSLDQIDNLEQYNLRITDNISGIRNNIVAGKAKIAELEKENARCNNIVSKVGMQLSESMPKMMVDEASKIHQIWKGLNLERQNVNEAMAELEKFANPYTGICASLSKTIKELDDEMFEDEKNIQQLDIMFSHYNYIYRSYSDRRKIKKWLLSELIPFLNDRIHYYLESFGLDISISFSSTLSSETNKWGYEFCSGGERKRIDLAIMFALYDLYMSIYGQQCNVMILDEVDGRLDKKGVEAFSDIINDFNTDNSTRPSPDTIFVISHKSELKDVFPSQITIRKKGNCSIIEQ